MNTNEIWDLLVERAGASEDERVSFVREVESRHGLADIEYPFRGSLGFGSKVNRVGPAPGKLFVWYVTQPSEDKTPESRVLIGELNEALEAASF